ncbi:MAG TPA: site-specific integrase [Nitrososphaeraceae archaeon]
MVGGRQVKINQRQQEQGSESENNRAFLNLINSLRFKSTIKTYRLALENYMQFMNIKSFNYSSLLKPDNKTIEQQLIAYLVDIRRNQKLSHASSSTRLAALRKFYELNDVVLTKVTKCINFIPLIL